MHEPHSRFRSVDIYGCLPNHGVTCCLFSYPRLQLNLHRVESEEDLLHATLACSPQEPDRLAGVTR
uniref:Uncharacterized protein n=1 Tax=Anguilla anguilla TaxID=7936 RepID=A0A0E9SYH1_ANGAN